MSEKLQFKVRLDAELHDLIREAAESNGRSINTEIIKRLELSFIQEKKLSDGVIDASQARQLADKGAKDSYASLLSLCMDIINNRARKGFSSAYVEVRYMKEDWDEDQKMDEIVLRPLVKKLESLGFNVEETEDVLLIRF